MESWGRLSVNGHESQIVRKIGMKARKDRRVERTRTALLNAFNDLVLNARKRDIRVSDIVERANVGRSTFYEHYSSAADIHMAALARPLTVLADAIAGDRDAAALEKLLEHFWENRQRARSTLSGGEGERVARLLASMLEERLAGRSAEPELPLRLAALQLAEGALALVRGWVRAEAPCTAERLARSICTTSALALRGLFPPEPRPR